MVFQNSFYLSFWYGNVIVTWLKITVITLTKITKKLHLTYWHSASYSKICGTLTILAQSVRITFQLSVFQAVSIMHPILFRRLYTHRPEFRPGRVIHSNHMQSVVLTRASYPRSRGFLKLSGQAVRWTSEHLSSGKARLSGRPDK